MVRSLIVVGTAMFTTAASAHHPLGGLPMETFSQGLLSGIGHPLLGFDHLFFVLLVGLVAALLGRRFIAPGAYLVAMLAGCLLASFEVAVPAVELMVALSLVTVGVMVFSGRPLQSARVLVVFAGFGLFHGAAFGATIAAQESGFGLAVLLGYLLGLGVTQYAIVLAASFICLSVWRVSSVQAIQPRLAGAMVAGAGLLLTLEQLEGPLLAMIAG